VVPNLPNLVRGFSSWVALLYMADRRGSLRSLWSHRGQRNRDCQPRAFDFLKVQRHRQAAGLCLCRDALPAWSFHPALAGWLDWSHAACHRTCFHGSTDSCLSGNSRCFSTGDLQALQGAAVICSSCRMIFQLNSPLLLF